MMCVGWDIQSTFQNLRSPVRQETIYPEYNSVHTLYALANNNSAPKLFIEMSARRGVI